MQVNSVFTKEVFLAAQQGDWLPLKAVPKADLHAHAMLSAYYSTFIDLSGGHLALPPARFDGYLGFAGFLRTNIFPLLCSIKAQCQVLCSALHMMVEDGVVYAELSFDLSMAQAARCSWEELVFELKKIIRSFSSQINVSTELGIAREVDSSFAKSEMERALSTNFFDGVDIYGDEWSVLEFPIKDLCSRFSERDLRVKLHAGEQTLASLSDHIFSSLAPHSIQHGILAPHDETVLERLRLIEGTVNVCPSSNVALGYASSISCHPIRQLYDARLPVTIGTDDFSIFGRTLSQEYFALFNLGVFSPAELENIRRTGLGSRAI